MNIVKQSVKLIWITPEPEKMIEVSGRTAYKSEDKITDDSSGKFTKQMAKLGHHSVIEHASASFRIVTDRGVSHEIVRHRIASYTQESTRYVNYGKKPMSFICPPGLETGYNYEIWYEACQTASEKYLEFLDRGVKPQIARAVLPTCLATKLVMTANLREFRHFISLRGSKAAHPQIRVIAGMIYNILVEHAPNVFSDLETVFE